MKKIIHIAPSLPPVINGLGDFCHILVNNLQIKGYTNNTFLVRKYGFSSSEKNITEFEPANFYEKLIHHKADIVILHYVGYAYNKRGMPFYIVKGLKEYKKREGCQVFVFFHELYSSSNSIFSLPFYTSFLQKRIVKKLYQIADATFTNCGIYHELLQKLVPNDTFKCICTGVFSNIPDDLYDHCIAKESSSMVVFGSLHKRKAVYENPSFTKLIQSRQISLIYDIGPGQINFSYPGIAFCAKGSLPSTDLAVYLNKAEFGALSYSPQLLGKSGIFSAYAAFGVIPINLLETDKPLYDGLIEGKNYFNCKTKLGDTATNYEKIKKEILSWYKVRNQQAVTDQIIKYIA